MILPETGQQKPFKGSFRSVCEQTLVLVNSNPFLAKKHGWPTTMEGMEIMVENYTVQRCLAGRWLDWLLLDAPFPEATPSYQKKTLLAGVVGGVARVKAGIGVLLEWLGDGGQPVDPALAVARASVCATCPKNDGGDFKAYFTKPIADRIRLQLEMRGEMQLRTSHDDKLTVCSACDCPLKLKVHVPIDYVLRHTSNSTRSNLDPRCWILSESAPAGDGAA